MSQMGTISNPSELVGLRLALPNKGREGTNLVFICGVVGRVTHIPHSVGRPRKKVELSAEDQMDVDERQTVESPSEQTLQEEGDAAESDFRMTVPQASDADASELKSPEPQTNDDVGETPAADIDSGAEEQENFKFLEFPSLLDPASWCFVPQAAAPAGILKGEEGMLNSIENWGEEDLRCMLDEVNAAKAAALDRVDVLRVLSRVVLRKIAEPIGTPAVGDHRPVEVSLLFTRIWHIF